MIDIEKKPLEFLLSPFLPIVSGFDDSEQFCAGLKGALICSCKHSHSCQLIVNRALSAPRVFSLM